MGRTGSVEDIAPGRRDRRPAADAGGPPVLDEERLLELEPYDVIDNPVVGQQHRLIEHDVDGDGAFLRYELRYTPDATSFTEHLHPEADETFRVLSGKLEVTVAGAERALDPGEQVTLPSGVPHTHRNAPGIETRVLSEVRPALSTESLLRGLAELAREGHTDDEGTPNLLPLAVFAAANPNLVYLSSPPVAVQKLLFRLLAPIGRLRGYRSDYPAER